MLLRLALGMELALKLALGLVLVMALARELGLAQGGRGAARDTRWQRHGLESRGGGRGEEREVGRMRWACWRRCWGRRR